jgi:hypothetical protein
MTTTTATYVRNETTGIIHACRDIMDQWFRQGDSVQYTVATLCGARLAGPGSIVTTTPDRISRNPDLCAACAKLVR